MSNERRYGKFDIVADWLRDNRPEVSRIMAVCAIFRAEHLFSDDVIEYSASCEKFRDLPKGEDPPRYRWFFNDSGDMWCEEIPR